MRPAMSSMDVNVSLLSHLLGEMEYRKQKNPYENPKTGEVTTKLIMLSDNIDDMFEVTVNGAVTEGTYRKGQTLDFKDCMVTFRASGARGFDNAINGVLNVSVKAGEVVITDNTFPNEKVNTESAKPDNKQNVKK